MIGGTKQGEISRSTELFQKILKSQGIYFALMFLIDSGYGPKDIQIIAEKLKGK